MIHHPDYHMSLFTPYIPAIRARRGDLVFISGVTAVPVYHDHPPEVFDSIPRDIEGQASLVFEHLDVALAARLCEGRHRVAEPVLHERQ